ncbi:hypothetical protein DID88_008904 [Monilinia fructigena]|uniref:Uncharacterized protein n=1 Tax=Monilinia fructigena TaxID=38457 RepID=A0A395J7S7_9HELO|nr:hypothetical protein DID88_008904 [Monilinia fructigena]
MARIKVPPIAIQDSTTIIEKELVLPSLTKRHLVLLHHFPQRPPVPIVVILLLRYQRPRPSTAESVGTITTSGSSLSPPPTSPRNLISTSKYLSNGDGPKADLRFDYNAVQEPAIANAGKEDLNTADHDLIQPYIDPKSEFDYYDQIEGHEELGVDINDPDIGLKFKIS